VGKATDFVNVPNNVRGEHIKKLGVRRSLRSLHEFSFAHQGVRILLRKKKKSRAVGLCGVPRSRAPFLHYASERPPLAVAPTIPNAKRCLTN